MKNMKLISATGVLAGLPLILGAWATTDGPPRVRIASDLIGMKVLSTKGESLGELEDIVVRSAGQSSYAVLSLDGVADTKDKLFAMPWSLLKPAAEDSVKPDTGNRDPSKASKERKDAKDEATADVLVLSIDKERLKSAPSFDKKNWPSVASADWATDIDAFYAQGAKTSAKKPLEAGARTSAGAWRATKLMDTDVETSTGDDLGSIEELAIDGNGRISYAVLSVGGFLGVGDKLVAVPWGSLKFSATKNKAGEGKNDDIHVTLSSTEDQLERAPEFKKGSEHAEEMCGSKWIASLYEYFSCPAYWNEAHVDSGAAKPRTSTGTRN